MTVRIGLGLGALADLGADDVWRWTDLCEAAGIDSLWHSDQMLGPGMEPVGLLAALAGRTARMRFGTSALVTPFRDPVLLAKQFATIDFLSGGRLLPVLGVGNASDPFWRATETAPAGRGARSDEAIRLLRALFEQHQVAFAGAHYHYHGPGITPRPAKPVPLWIGGNTAAAFRRTARLGDGWLGSMIAPEAAGEARRAIEAALAETGRTIDGDHYGMTLMVRIGASDDPAVHGAMQRMAARMPAETRHSAADMFVTGTPDAAVAKLRRFVEAGISKFVLMPMAGSAGDLIEQTERIASDVAPRIES